jgi:group I intron endonuclease
MSRIKNTNYLAITNFEVKYFSLQSLKSIPGIYMITNKVTKKFYMGMSTNLKGRIEDYLNLNILNRNRSSRIHKALLKYGYKNFSISILQLDMNKKNIYNTF